MSEIEETAKALTETAKFGTTSVESVTKMGRFLARVFGMPIENAVGIIGDKIEYTRWERQNRLIDKVIEEQNKRELTEFRAIPPKFAIPIIFNASIEEDNDLQDMWCKLLTNCIDPTFRVEIRYAFIEIIKNLTPFDAKLLAYIYSSEIDSRVARSRNTTLIVNFITNGSHNPRLDNLIKDSKESPYSIDIQITRSQIIDNFTASINKNDTSLDNGARVMGLVDKIDISLDNLLRVNVILDTNLLQSIKFLENTAITENISTGQVTEKSTLFTPGFIMSKLGFDFIRACLT